MEGEWDKKSKVTHSDSHKAPWMDCRKSCWSGCRRGSLQTSSAAHGTPSSESSCLATVAPHGSYSCPRAKCPVWVWNPSSSAPDPHGRRWIRCWHTLAARSLWSTCPAVAHRPGRRGPRTPRAGLCGSLLTGREIRKCKNERGPIQLTWAVELTGATAQIVAIVAVQQICIGIGLMVVAADWPVVRV